MAEAEKTTRERVEELFDDGTTEAKKIAEALDVKQATVYVHLRKIREERGEKPRGRGRPKANADADEKPKPAAKSKTRPAPKRANPTAKSGEKATEAEKPKAAPTAKSNGNGNHVTGAERFPIVADAIEKQIAGKKREVEVLENMLAGLTK